MPIGIIVQTSSGERKIMVPFKFDQSVKFYIEQSLTRTGLNKEHRSEDCKLFLRELELFPSDTLQDLDISDNTTLTLHINNQNIPENTNPNPNSKTENKEDSLPLTETSKSSSSSELPFEIENLQMNNESQIRLQQIDMVVMDVSGSMKGKAFKGDIITRIEAAQAFFQSYLDKFVQHEVAAAVGLVCFGEKIEQTFGITRNFDSFSTELGNIEANQGQTRLYEAIAFAGSKLEEYRQQYANFKNEIVCRVFCLTDGQDNSGVDPFQVYQYLKKINVVVDSIGIGTDDHTKLSNLTRSTGGSCFIVDSVESGSQLFEREAVVSPSLRENFNPFSLNLENKQQFENISGEKFCSHEVKRTEVVSSKSRAIQLNEETLQKKLQILETQSTTSPNTTTSSSSPNTTTSSSSLNTTTSSSSLNTTTSSSSLNTTTSSSSLNTTTSSSSSNLGTSKCLVGRNKRVLKEYTEICQSEEYKKEEIQVWVDETDIGVWKVSLKGPEQTPYENYFFALTFQFPDDYPFKGPKVRFSTKIYHPNINNDGAVCLDVLKNLWSPSFSALKICRMLGSLLESPNPYDPLDAFKAQLLRDNKEQYLQNVKQWVQDHAFKSLSDLKVAFNVHYTP